MVRPLPGWLTFDAATQTFSGMAGMGGLSVLPVKITATDTGGLSATVNFKLTVTNMVTGTIYNDTLNGIAGLDYIQAIGGNDVVNAGDETFLISGTDTTYDRFKGDAGFDVIQGGAGNDTIRVNYFTGASTVEKIDGGLGIIRDRVSGVGGMNHFMPPASANADGWKSTSLSAATRYGNFAMERLINVILKNSGQRQNLEVKLFGGWRILVNMTDIGMRNIIFARDYNRGRRAQGGSGGRGGHLPAHGGVFPRHRESSGKTAVFPA